MSETDHQNENNQAVVDFADNSSGVWRILLLGAVLVGGVTFVSIYGRQYFGEPVFLAILGAFASLGIFFLFALVLGLIKISSANRTEQFAKGLIDEMDSGIVVSDEDGRIIYANKA